MSNIIFEGLKVEIDNGLPNIIPGYNFFKTVFSNHQIIQKNRAKEFLEFIKTNEQYFVVELIHNECFISGLALTLKQVIEQYSEIKRQHIYNIFLGFTKAEDKEKFELEKLYFTLNLISLEDLETLKVLDLNTHVTVLTGQQNKYTSLNSLGIFDTSPVWGGNRYQLNNFGQKFKEFAFQTLV